MRYIGSGCLHAENIAGGWLSLTRLLARPSIYTSDVLYAMKTECVRHVKCSHCKKRYFLAARTLYPV